MSDLGKPLPEDWRYRMFRRLSETAQDPEYALARYRALRAQSIKEGTASSIGLDAIDREIARLVLLVQAGKVSNG